jgi:hypothetical protein
MQKKSFNKSDETRTLPKTKIEVVNLGDKTLMHTTFDVGWKWSENVKPTAGTDSCQTHHFICALSGQLKTVMDDGTEIEVMAGEVIDIPPGHDAWVVGDEPFVGIDLGGSASYAKLAS